MSARSMRGIALIGIAIALADNPALLLVPEALTDVGRPGQVGVLSLGFVILRLGCMIYLLLTAARHLRGAPQHPAGAAIPAAAALACVAADPWIHGSGLLVCAVVAADSWRSARRAATVT
ncbi:MAG: hypothetical protein HC871_09040 [Rhizobiales bacterium]|nr:hypothetical protein [Hyphomicrobiales bacterium]